MQRRAAAVSAVVLLLVAAGAYVFVGFAEEPGIDVEADHTLGADDTVTEGDRTYTVTALGPDVDAGSEGVEATLEWTNESARHTAAIENNSTVPFGDADRRVLVPNESDPAEFSLEEQLNVTAILREDPDVENSTLRDDEGNRYVRYTNGSTRSLDEYLPAPVTDTVTEGDTFEYQNNSTTVASVGPDEIVLEWTAPRTTEIPASEGANVTLGETTYLAHFPDNSTLVLTTDFEGYEESNQRVQYFEERIAGLWGVSIVSSLAAILLVAMAYLPSRY